MYILYVYVAMFDMIAKFDMHIIYLSIYIYKIFTYTHTETEHFLRGTTKTCPGWEF